MGGRSGAPLREGDAQTIAVGHDGRGRLDTSAARQRHGSRERVAGPAGGGEEQVSGHARAMPLEARGSGGGVGESSSPTTATFQVAQAGPPGKVTRRPSPSDTTAGAGSTPRLHDSGTARANASLGQPEAERNRSVGTRARCLSRHGGASGAWASQARPRQPLFKLRRLGCASRLASGVNYCILRAPLGTASRLRGAPLSSPVVSSPSNTSCIRMGPRRCATSDRVTVVPLYSRAAGVVKP